MISGKYTLDRYEGNLAILLYRLDETLQVEIPKNSLKVATKEGDILDIVVRDGVIINATVLKEETEKAREQVNKLLEKILRKQ